jgi:hemoglobin
MSETKEPSLFELIGGTPTLQKVHKIFYDKIYADPWLGQFFQNVKQETIENQQTDFMTGAMGGVDKYSGKLPIPAHQHMFITAELFDLRSQMLKASLAEAGIAPELTSRWLRIDGAFRRGIVKSSLADCEKRFATDNFLNFSNPQKKIA